MIIKDMILADSLIVCHNKAAWNFDQGRIDPKLTSMAKMYAARTAVEVADEAIQLLGGLWLHG